MKIEIEAKAKFWIPLTLEQVNVLTKLSKYHYDHTCRMASEYGGFLYGWNNVVTYGISTTKEPSLCSASWRELDICLKIMEMPGHLCNEEELNIISDLRKHFRGALRLASAHLPTWTAEYHG